MRVLPVVPRTVDTANLSFPRPFVAGVSLSSPTSSHSEENSPTIPTKDQSRLYAGRGFEPRGFFSGENREWRLLRTGRRKLRGIDNEYAKVM